MFALRLMLREIPCRLRARVRRADNRGEARGLPGARFKSTHGKRERQRLSRFLLVGHYSGSTTMIQCALRVALLLQTEHVLHVVKARGFAQQIASSAQCALGKRRTACSPVCDLNPLTSSREQCSVIAHDVSAPNRGEPDRRLLSLASDTLTAEYCVFRQVAPQRSCNDFSQTQRRTGRCIDLEPMMRFDNLDVVVIFEHLCSNFSKLEGQIDADAHVGRHHDWNGFRRIANDGLLRRLQTRCANDHAYAQPAAQTDMN